MELYLDLLLVIWYYVKCRKRSLSPEYRNEGFSFCLYSYIRKTKFSNFLNNRIILSEDMFFQYKPHCFFSSLENIILTNIYTYSWWHHWLCNEWHLVPRGVIPIWWYMPIPYTFLMIWWHMGWCPCTPAQWGVSQVQWAPWWHYMVYLSLRSGVSDKTSSYVQDNWYFLMFLLNDGSLILMYMASLIVLVRLHGCLPMIEKLSTLLWWPVMLVWL